MPTHSRCVISVLLAAMCWGPLFILQVNAQNSVTSVAPSQLVFVPDALALVITKHPTLPILYVNTSREPKAMNIVTYDLNSDGAIAVGSEKSFEPMFTANRTNKEFVYSFFRPIVLAEERVMLLPARPYYPAQFYAETNNNEFAAVSLDEKGRLSKLIKTFRTDWTTRSQLVNAQWDGASRRLFYSYNLYFGWSQVGRDGLPSSAINHLPQMAYQWIWTYMPEWQRFFCMFPGAAIFQIGQLTKGGMGMDCYETVSVLRGVNPPGNLTVNSKLGKIYLLDSQPGSELVVCSLTKAGRLTSTPRYFSIGAANAMRFDFKAGLLYAFANGGTLRIFKLDDAGYPIGTPQTFELAFGEFHDALVDITGKVYVAASRPLTAKP